MDYVDLKVGGQLIQRTEVYPFQFRYTPPASAVGRVVTLTAEAVDSAGNKSTRDLLVNVVAGDAPPASPVAGRPADAARHADGRLAAGLHQRRVPERADVADLRVAAQRRRHRRRDVAELHAHRRRPRPLGRLPHHGHQRPRLRRRDLRGAGRLQPGAGLHGDAAAGHGGRPDDHDHGDDEVGAASPTRRPASWPPSKKAIACTVASSSKSTKFTAKVRLQGKTHRGREQGEQERQAQAHAEVPQGAQEGPEGGPERQERQDDHGVHRQGVLTPLTGPRRTRRGPCHPPDV